jgi:hypothetical protein
MNRNIALLCSLTSMMLALAGAPAHAALGGDSGIVIPYAGKLELNGALITGTIGFRFEVLVNDTTTAVCQTKEITDVPVTNGEFAVTISRVSEACVKGQDVHLRIAVKQGDGSFVVLGKQRVTPVVGALTSGPGDFAVTDRLTAKSLTVVDPAVSNAPGINITTTKISAVGPILSTQNITLQPKDGQGGTGLVEVQGALTATSLSLTGPLTVTGAVDVPVGSITGPMLRADPIGCVTLSKRAANTGGFVKEVIVSLTDFGFGTTHTRTGGGCNCGSNNPGRLMVVNVPISSDAWLCQCKDHVTGDGNGETIAFVIGCRLK